MGDMLITKGKLKIMLNKFVENNVMHTMTSNISKYPLCR